jgi:hypothetical protein
MIDLEVPVMKRIKEQHCHCCKELFTPNYRSAKRQKYCLKDDCRNAAKAASQRLWLQKNPDYFKGSDHVKRVQDWRRANPGRGRRKSSADVLQENCEPIPPTKQDVTALLPPESPALPAPPTVLQDFCLLQDPVFVGLIVYMTGCALQENFDRAILHLEQLGLDVRGSKTTSGGQYDPQVPHPPRPHPYRSPTVQLGGSPLGS